MYCELEIGHTVTVHDVEIIKKRMNKILSENTGKSVETVTADCERDNFMTAQQAMEYGLIDKVIATKSK